MTSEKTGNKFDGSLTIKLPTESVPVSYLSNLLRVVQAALRETASSTDDTLSTMSTNPAPLLFSSFDRHNGITTAFMYFGDANDNRLMEEFTKPVVHRFLEGLNEFLNGNAQSSLWGYTVSEQRNSYGKDSDVRYAQVTKVMKKLSPSSLSSDSRCITFTEDGFEAN